MYKIFYLLIKKKFKYKIYGGFKFSFLRTLIIFYLRIDDEVIFLKCSYKLLANNLYRDFLLQ